MCWLPPHSGARLSLRFSLPLGARHSGETPAQGTAPLCLTGSWAPCANTQRAAAASVTIQVTQAGEPDAETHQRKQEGIKQCLFVSMETAPQGGGGGRERFHFTSRQDLGSSPFCGWAHPSPPSLPGVHHGNPSSKQEVQRCSSIWCWGSQGARGGRCGWGNGAGWLPSLPDRTLPFTVSWDHFINSPL